MTTLNFLLQEMIFFVEFFIAIATIYLISYCLFTFFNTKKFPLIQRPLLNLVILILLMSCFLLWNENLVHFSLAVFSNALINDGLSVFSKIVILFSSIVCLFFIKSYIITQKINSFEYLIILLFSILGLFLLCSSNDLMMAYLAIELQSLSFYVMSAFKKKSSYSVTSGLKYFILGAFSSGLFLFGSSILYGAYGSINFTEFSCFYLNESTFLLENNLYFITVIGLFFVFVSIFFKLALAPFHLWSPDVYENSPSSSSFFFAVIPKISLFLFLVRLSYYGFYEVIGCWQEIIVVIAISSIFVGSFGGLDQRKFKSLLAYSSISNMGYLLVAFVSGLFEGLQMLFCYLLVYMLTSLCLWGVFILIRAKATDARKQNKDLANFGLLKKSNPFLAIILSTAFFSIAGLPPVIGFFVKLNIFLIAIKKTMFYISFLSAVFSVIGAFYYLRVVKILYFEPLLVGKLYYPLTEQNVLIVAVLFHLFLFLFLNPSILYLLTYKTCLLFLCF